MEKRDLRLRNGEVQLVKDGSLKSGGVQMPERHRAKTVTYKGRLQNYITKQGQNLDK